MSASERFLSSISNEEVGLAPGITLPGRGKCSEAQHRVLVCETQDLETTSRHLVCVTLAWASPGDFGAWAVLPTSSGSTQHRCRMRARQGLFKAMRLLEKWESLLFSILLLWGAPLFAWWLFLQPVPASTQSLVCLDSF